MWTCALCFSIAPSMLPSHCYISVDLKSRQMKLSDVITIFPLIKWFHPQLRCIPHEDGQICGGVLCPQSVPSYLWKNSWAHVLLCFSISLQRSCNQSYVVPTSFQNHTDIILHNDWKNWQREEKKYFYYVARVILIIITQWLVNEYTHWSEMKMIYSFCSVDFISFLSLMLLSFLSLILCFLVYNHH